MKIALFLPNWIGDAVMATPAMRAIRKQFPDAEIIAVLRPYVSDVLEGLGLVDRLIFDRKRFRRDYWKLAGELRRERLDLAVLFPNSFRSAALAWLAGAKKRAGMNRDGRGWILTEKVTPKPKTLPHPVIDEYLRLASAVGCTKLSRNMEQATTTLDRNQLKDFWKRHQHLDQAGVICLNPGGAFGSSKHWPTASFGELARRLAEQTSHTILVLCGPAETEEARAIQKQANHSRVLTLADERLSIGLTKAAVEQSRMLITTDSGPRHFAPPFGVPVVSLFGPTHIDWSETYYPDEVQLQIPVDCGPCQQRICPLGHLRCMTDLTVDQVFQAAISLLERTARRNAAA